MKKEQRMTNGSDMALLKRLLPYLSSFKKRAVPILICLAVTTAVGFFRPLVIRSITDEGMVNGNLHVIVKAVILLLVLVFTEQLIELFLSKIFVQVSNETHAALYTAAFKKIMRLKMSYYVDRNHAEIINSVQSDVSNVSTITDQYFVMVFSQILRVLSGIAGLLIISWKLTIIVLALAPAHFFITKALAKKKERALDQSLESNREFYGWFGDNISGIREIKLWGLHNTRYQTFQGMFQKILKLTKDVTMLDSLNMALENMLSWLVTGVLYIIGGVLIISNSLSIGGVFAFISYSGFVTGPIAYIFSIRYFFSRIFPSARRLFRFLDMEEENDGGEPFTEKSEGVELSFKDVHFSYREGSPVLNGVSFQIYPGEKLAIIGTNGSGKSTILQLLMRFLDPDRGEIQINNMDVSKLQLDEYRGLFSVVSQEPYLFNDTLLRNIDPKGIAGEDRLQEALRQSGAKDFVDKLSDGVQSRVGWNGARLSGGEKQKLAVARALILDTPIVILDEATSGYDVQSDAYLHDVLLNEFKSKTVVMVTHRYENLSGFDKVYRLEGGKLVDINMQ